MTKARMALKKVILKAFSTTKNPLRSRLLRQRVLELIEDLLGDSFKRLIEAAIDGELDRDDAA